MASKKPKATPIAPDPSNVDKAKRILIDESNNLGKLKDLGGSMSDEWNNTLGDQVFSAMWTHRYDEASADDLKIGVIKGMFGIAPRDEIEGMLVAQMVAIHNASMECLRRAMIPEQPHIGRESNLNQANKLSRTYSTLVETLNRHRGKGSQQKVTVKHVHVHDGGQAAFGNFAPGSRPQEGGGGQPETEGQPHALGHVASATLWGVDPRGEPVPVAGDGEWTMPNARRPVAGSADG